LNRVDVTRDERSAVQALSLRFRVRQSLKRSLGIETMLAEDRPTGALVVVKAAPVDRVPQGTRLRLEHEARVLREVRGRGLASLVDSGNQDGWLWLATEFVPGWTLQERLRVGPLSVTETLGAGQSVLEALVLLHERDILHGDLKPANVIVNRDGPIEDVTLVDFGLSRSEWLEPSVRGEVAGTVRYMSPEQAGALAFAVGPRSDLYAVGLLLYECLAGRVAFPGEHAGEVLRAHLTVDPPGLDALGVKVPRALDDIVRRLMKKDPRDRYQTAAAVLADLQALAGALQRGETEPVLVVGRLDHRATLAEPALVGRRDELRALQAEIDRAAAGQGGLVCLEGDSGAGKSRLLDELSRAAALAGAWVLRGQAVEQSASGPFEVLRGVVAEVVSGLSREPELAPALRTSLGERASALGVAFPEVARVLEGVSAGSRGLDEHGEARTVNALHAFLTGLGTPERVAVVLLDDVQWADDLVSRLLVKWARDGRAPRHTLIVAAYRERELSSTDPLRDESHAVRVGLAPLRAAETRQLAESLAGPIPAEALGLVERLSEGNPFVAQALVQGMVETGALVAGRRGWEVHAPAMGDVQASRKATLLLQKRLEVLPRPSQRLLEAGAVLGRRFEVAEAARLAGLDADEAAAAARELRGRHILWGTSQRHQLALAHDRLRQLVLDRMDPQRKRVLHGQAAALASARDGHTPGAVAYHWAEANELERALAPALEAAREARSRYALAVAEEMYRVAERSESTASDAERLEIFFGLGDVLALRGRYGAARDCLGRALPLAGDALARARVQARLGDVARMAGDLATGAGHLSAALRLTGCRVPRSALGFVLHGLLLLVQAALLHGLRRLRRPAPEPGPAALLASRVLGGLVLALASSKSGALWGLSRTLVELQRGRATPEAARAHALVGSCLGGIFGWYGRGREAAHRGLSIATALGDPDGAAQCRASLAFGAIGEGTWHCVERLGAETAAASALAADSWVEAVGRSFHTMGLVQSGQLAEAITGARALHAENHGEASAHALLSWSVASGGQLPPELVGAEPPSATVTTKHYFVACARAICLLREGHPVEAARLLEEQRCQGMWPGVLLAWQATALRVALELAPQHTRRRAQRRLAGAVAGAVRRARRHPGGLAHALREEGLLAALQGHPRKARRLLEAALALAERQGAALERAQTLLARGRVGRTFAWPGAERDEREALASLRAMGARLALGVPLEDDASAPVTVSLADRYEAVLEAGRRVASTLERAAALAALRGAALELLRAEDCAVLEVEGDAGSEPIRWRALEGEATVTTTLVSRALASGQPEVMADGVPVADSAVLEGLRSALCVPLRLQGAGAPCVLYATHRRVGGLFGDDEVRIAQYLAALGGAALDNAERLRQVEESGRACANLADEVRRLGRTVMQTQEDERRRLAGRLHDEAEQILLVAKVQADQLGRLGLDLAAAPHLSAIKRHLQQAIESLRELAHELRPAALDWLGLGPALHDLVTELNGPDLQVHTEVESHGALPDDVAVGAFRIAQAALANVVRHARARRVRLVMGVEGGELRLGIEDDGVGFDPERPGPGLGMLAMRERALWLGGRMEIDSKPGRGTRVQLHVPLP
jgi:signal transduction histidine kinase